MANNWKCPVCRRAFDRDGGANPLGFALGDFAMIRVCGECHAVLQKQYETYNHTKTCEVCRRESETLAWNDTERFRLRGKKLCPDCFERYVRTCACCGKKLGAGGDWQVAQSGSVFVGLFLCNECAENPTAGSAADLKAKDESPKEETLIEKVTEEVMEKMKGKSFDEQVAAMTEEYNKRLENLSEEERKKEAENARKAELEAEKKYKNIKKFLKIFSPKKSDAQADSAKTPYEKIQQCIKDSSDDPFLNTYFSGDDKEKVVSALRELVIDALGEDADLSKPENKEAIAKVAADLNEARSGWGVANLGITADDIIRAK